MTPQPARTGRRARVLAALRDARAPMSIAEIAEQLAVHPNTVRFHLEALLADGQAERVEAGPTGPGRPAQMFRAHRGMDPAGPRNYRLLADILIAQLADEPSGTARAIEAGRSWGRGLTSSPTKNPDAGAAAAELVRVLDDLGFAPESAANTTRINLRHCPFLDMGAADRSVVCPIHLGLMKGVLEARSAPLTVDRLEPFVQPDLCVAHLAAIGAGA
ncbi:helix-turn-helix transcriptional regulator [Jongsikchunia kroppenstedtii]|uniref:helix-turn-helix transcriptional regulator n=1 Tax=Jongsikchunia kroppenstedtii TaxID=1121721 RepID=UPI0003637E19|nr:helix-turn-helix domain-containing protein [Jongsikchunia kroppenstedtii]